MFQIERDAIGRNMGYFIHAFVAMLIGPGLGLVIGIVLLFVRTRRDAANAPSQDRQRHLIDIILEQKRQGWSYSERLAHLRSLGLRRNVADFILGEAERVEGERPTKG